ALAGCHVVDVYARPPLQGHTELLPPEIAWRYRVGRATPQGGRSPPRRLVVANDNVPPELELEPLGAWGAATSSESGELVTLAGPAATVEAVLREMKRATDIEFFTHGLVDLGVSDVSFLVLSPGAGGLYALTARQV